MSKRNKRRARAHKARNVPRPKRQRKQTLSVCMIVRDEAHNLPLCLENVRHVASEIIVVDTGSVDNTVEVAKSLGAKVHFFDWCDDFGAARNVSIEHATGDWILWLDGDDRMASEDCDKLRELIPQPTDRAFYFILANSGPNASQCRQLRVVPRRPDIRFQGNVHEQLASDCIKVGLHFVYTDVKVVHTGYEDPEVNKQKLQRNQRLLKKQIEEFPDHPHSRFYYASAFVEDDPPRSIQMLKDLMDWLIGRDLDQSDVFKHTALMAGSVCEKHQRLDDAIDIYRKLLEHCPDHALGHFLLARGLIKASLFDEAREHADIAVRDGIQPYSFPLAIDTFTAEARLARAVCLEAANELEAALEEAKQSLNICHTLGPAMVHVAKLLQRLGRDDESRSFLQSHASKHDLNHAEALALAAQAALDDDDLDAARKWAEKAADQEADHSDLLVKVADALLAKDRLDDAKAAFDKASQCNEALMSPHLGLGNVAFHRGDFVAARAAYQKAEALDPRAPGVANNLGNVEYRTGRYAEAADNYRRAIALGKDDAPTHMNLGAALWQLGQLDQAIDEYRAAFAKDDACVDAIAAIGDICLQRQDFPSALKMYETYLRRAPKNPDGFCKLGACYRAMGQTDAARACYEQALKIDPTHALAAKQLAAQ